MSKREPEEFAGLGRKDPGAVGSGSFMTEVGSGLVGILTRPDPIPEGAAEPAP